MGKTKGKPKMQIRKPPAGKSNTDKVAAFVGGESSKEHRNSDVQKSGRSESQTSKKARRQTTVYFDQDVFKDLKVHCALESAEMSSTVTEAVRQFLATWNISSAK